METAQLKPLNSSMANLQEKYDELVEFLEYENAYTKDHQTEKRIRLKLIKLNIWPKKNQP